MTRGPQFSGGVAARPLIAAIDDSPDLLQLMKDFLGDEGYEVNALRSTRGAHQYLREAKPSLLILDLMVSEVEGGWNLLQALKIDPETSSIPVIICSGATNILERRKEWFRQFECQILPKPFDLDDMLWAVQRALIASQSQ